jgi:hypothetical protein
MVLLEESAETSVSSSSSFYQALALVRMIMMLSRLAIWRTRGYSCYRHFCTLPGTSYRICEKSFWTFLTSSRFADTSPFSKPCLLIPVKSPGYYGEVATQFRDKAPLQLGVTLPQQELGASLGYKLKPACALRAAATSPDRSLEFCVAE